MLRSLDPDANFEAPKSKQHRPSNKELSKFSEDELDSIRRAEQDDEALRVRRFARRQQHENALKAMQESQQSGSNGAE